MPIPRRASVLVVVAGALAAAGCTSSDEHAANLTAGTPTEQVEAVRYFTESEPEGEVRPEFRELVLSVAEGAPSGVGRSAALQVMGEKKDPAFLEALLSALEDPSFIARYRAAEALGKYGDPSAVLPLARVLEDDEHDWVRMEAAQALTQIGDRRAIEPLIHALDEDNPAPVRFDAYLGLKALTGLSLDRRRETWVEWWEKEGRRRYPPLTPASEPEPEPEGGANE